MAIDFSKVKFFVEGDGDKVFLRDLLKILFAVEFTDIQLKELIIICGGYNGLQKQKDEFLQINAGKKREGGINIVLFDADYEGREFAHGFNPKMKFLQEEKQRLDIKFESFLFPNNESDGTLETILEQCINPKHVAILNCWKGFESCINDGKNNYTIPANKTKIYAYLECLYGTTNSEKDKIKDKNRNFCEADKWMFDTGENKTIKKLNDFLANLLSNYEIQ